MTPKLLLTLGLCIGLFHPLVLWLWPRYRRGILPFMLLVHLVVYPLLWQMPGLFAVTTAMALAGSTLRAHELARTLPATAPRLQFLTCWLFLTRHPQAPARPVPVLAPGWRVARGIALTTAAAGSLVLGNHVQLWRSMPYLDDLWMAANLGLFYLGQVEIVSPLAHRVGLTEFLILVEGLSPRFAWSPSLRRFWSSDWNRIVSGVLRRGVFDAVGGRRKLKTSVMAVFVVSGLLHGPAMLLAGGAESRHLWAIMAVGGGAFFVIHGAACLLEGAVARGRRRWLGRVTFYATFLLTLPLYPAPLFVAFGAHGRPVEATTPVLVLRWAGVL